MDRRWYTKFFSGVVVEMWRQAMPAELTRQEVDFLEQELKLQPGQRVLDVPCGFGRHSLELARRGYQMTGVDVSAEMIQAAKELAGKAGAKIEWRQAEMRELTWRARFDAAFCFGNSFGYLDRSGMRHFLGAVAKGLKSGSRFAFDYGLAAESILPRFTEREWCPIGGLYFLENNRYDVAESCIETVYTFIQEGSVETRTGLHWVYTTAEIREMLSTAGFATRSLYGSCERQPFQLKSPLIVVAEKQ